jgi:hypothetical protein
MFLRVFKRTFWQFYENLFKGVIINFLFFLLLLIVFIIFFMRLARYEMTFLIFFFIWHIICPGIIYYLLKIVTLKEYKNMFTEIFDGIIKYFLQGVAIFLINIAFFFLFFLVYNFYRQLQSVKILSLILAGISVWIAIVFLLMQIYLIPILVLDEKKRIFISYKKAAIMVLSAPFSSIFCLILIAYFLLLFYPFLGIFYGSQIPVVSAVISLFPIFLMPFLSFIVIMLLQINSTLIIYEKHNIMPDLKEKWEEKNMSNFFRPWENK